MPATRSRMSVSSSTTRISAAIGSLTCDLWLFRFGSFALAGRGKANTDPGTPLARNFFRGVAQFDATAVLLDNAPDDRQAKPGALFPRCDVRFEQPVTICLWQTDAIVDDIDYDVGAVATRVDVDHAFAKVDGRHRRDRFSSIFDNVGKCLRDQTPIKLSRHWIFRDLNIDLDL